MLMSPSGVDALAATKAGMKARAEKLPASALVALSASPTSRMPLMVWGITKVGACPVLALMSLTYFSPAAPAASALKLCTT